MSSSNSYSYSSSSYSTSSTSSSSANGTTTSGSRSAHQSYTDPSGNTTTRSAAQNLGEPPVLQSAQFDAQGRQLESAGSAQEARRLQEGGPQIEDVTEESEKEAAIDRKYREAMEEEYAKREGGA